MGQKLTSWPRFARSALVPAGDIAATNGARRYGLPSPLASTASARLSGQFYLAFKSAATEGVRKILHRVRAAALDALVLAGAVNA